MYDGEGKHEWEGGTQTEKVCYREGKHEWEGGTQRRCAIEKENMNGKVVYRQKVYYREGDQEWEGGIQRLSLAIQHLIDNMK